MKMSSVIGALLLSTMTGSLIGASNAAAQTINSANVQAIAIYRTGSGLQGILTPDKVNFNITQSSLIDSLVSAIDFSVARDASDLLPLPNGYLYIKYKDNSVGVFQLFSVWGLLCKPRNPGRSYYISLSARMRFQAHAQ